MAFTDYLEEEQTTEYAEEPAPAPQSLTKLPTDTPIERAKALVATIAGAHQSRKAMIDELLAQRAAAMADFDAVLAALEHKPETVAVEEPKRRGRKPGKRAAKPVDVAATGKKRTLSPEARERIAAAQRKRRAAEKKSSNAAD